MLHSTVGGVGGVGVTQCEEGRALFFFLLKGI